MTACDNRALRYLSLGRVAVGIDCPNNAFAATAGAHLFLSDNVDSPIAATVRYVPDDSVNDLLAFERKKNVVYIDRQKRDDGRERVLLGLFGDVTVVLEPRGNDMVVTHSTHASIRILLDDVLQAALQPVLDALGGFILHGACMVRDQKGLVFMGASGAGKSTTAFNLTRFGFCGYADDAVLVTHQDERLHVWPLTRELSVRPLSFRLFQKQSIELGPYKKDGDKYYFPQPIPSTSGAVLEHICFLELTGERDSRLTALTKTQTLDILHASDRHFSFMGRTEAEKYARILTQYVPTPLHARLGVDLDVQGAMFDRLFIGRAAAADDATHPAASLTMRSEKSALIQQAWSSPNQEALQQLIPLLGDYDPPILKLALGFFQTYPLARIEPLAEPDARAQLQTTDEAAWLRTSDWLRGCQLLLEQSGEEVWLQFFLPWLRSAPVLYPFLKVLLNEHRSASKQLVGAWQRCRAQRTQRLFHRQCHLVGFHNGAMWDVPESGQWLRAMGAAGTPPTAFYAWVAEGAHADWPKWMSNWDPTSGGAEMKIVPVLAAQETIESSINLVRAARDRGIGAAISQPVPLCRLSDADARFLLGVGAIDTPGDPPAKEVLFFTRPGDAATLKPHGVACGVPWTNAGVQYVAQPYEGCPRCRLYSLGLCRGGFFTMD